MFTDERVSTIFGNMEALYYFQSNFLRELEMCIDWQEPFKSCIGATFIRNVSFYFKLKFAFRRLYSYKFVYGWNDYVHIRLSRISI